MNDYELNELDSMCGISDEELTERFVRGVEIEIEIMKLKGIPIPRYDSKTDQAYLEYPDGKKVYV